MSTFASPISSFYLLFIIHLLAITNLTICQTTSNINSDNNGPHGIRHQQHRLQQNPHLLTKMEVHSKRSLFQNEQINPNRTRKSVGGNSDDASAPKYITAVHHSISVQVKNGKIRQRQLKAFNQQQSNSTAFIEQTLCMVGPVVREQLFPDQCGPPGVPESPLNDGSEHMVTQVTYHFPHKNDQYYICAERNKSKAVLKSRKAMKTRADWEPCVWKTFDAKDNKISVYLYTYFLDISKKCKSAKNETLFLTLDEKRRKAKIDGKKVSWKKVKLRCLPNPEYAEAKFMEKVTDESNFLIHYNKTYPGLKLDNPMYPTKSPISSPNKPRDKPHGKKSRKKECSKNLLGGRDCEKDTKTKRRKDKNLLQGTGNNDNFPRLIPRNPFLDKSLLDSDT